MEEAMKSAGSGVVQGTVAAGFESVKTLFAEQMTVMAEENAQLCVYFSGEKVVDLWVAKTEAFSADSLTTVFSSGKTLECVALAWLVSEGLLNYSDKLSQHWPLFASGGKQDVTVADLMRHEAGLASFETLLNVEDFYRENIKNNAVGSVIEREELYYRHPENKREYHTLSRGWIVNELFRRVDPAGRTVGEFMSEEIQQPLQADVYVGIPESLEERVAPVIPLGLGYQLFQSLLPRAFGRRVKLNIFQLVRRFYRIAGLLRGGDRPPATTLFKNLPGLGFINSPAFARGEHSSAGAQCSARGLAKVGAMMAAGGSWQGKTYINEAAWQAAHAEPIQAPLGGLVGTDFTQGGMNRYREDVPGSSYVDRAFTKGRDGFYGWMGFGGSIFQWHPSSELSFAFVPTMLHSLDMLDERGAVYQAEVQRCVKALKGE